jgi:preprotein translocase subunit SecA
LNKNNFETIERHIFLIILDKHWKKHLNTIECLRSMINFRTYAEKNPYDEYRKEIYKIFIKMVYNIKLEIVEAVFNFSKYSDIPYINYNYSEKSY